MFSVHWWINKLPVYAGFLQCKMLGAAIQSWDEKGQEIEGETGELVITEPLPSMPYFFGVDNNFEKYHDSYFEKIKVSGLMGIGF